MEAVPTFDQLIYPTLKALRSLGGSASNDELLQKVIEIEGIPDEVASVKHTDDRQTKLNYNLGWAKTYLKKAGAINNSQRGVWAITDAGEDFTQEDCLKVPAQVRSFFPGRRSERKTDSDDGSPPSGDDWKDELLVELRQMAPAAFERLAHGKPVSSRSRSSDEAGTAASTAPACCG